MFRKYAPFLFILMLLLASCSSNASHKRDSFVEDIPTDPQLISGKLDNGLHYYVRENDRPSNRAELRLVVNAGSILEDEDQRGLAHFLEHMAFNGTQQFPHNELVSFLQEIGMDFGADVNAYTSFDETVYMLSVPTDDPELFSQAMDVLEQWAFHLTIEPEEVEKERGVVMEEWRLGRGAQQRIMAEFLPVLFQDSRYAQRLPIGLREVIATADHSRLQRFYRDWYRPELMAVIAVGDFSAEQVQQDIIDRFSSYENPEGPRERFISEIPIPTEPSFSFVSDPEARHTSVELLVPYEPLKIDSADDYRLALTEMMFYDMINQRFFEIEQAEQPPFISAHAYTTNYTRWSAQSGIEALVRPAGIEDALEALAEESQRIVRYGFLQSELDRSRDTLLSSMESYWKNRDNREHKEFLSDIQEHYLKHTPLPGIDWEWDRIQRLLPQITLEDFAPLISQRLASEHPIVFISGSEEIQEHPLLMDDALAILDRAADTHLASWSDSAQNGELLPQEPVAGGITNQSFDAESGIYTLALTNGATVYLKPTDFKSDEVLYGAFSPGGLSLVGDEQYVSGQLASTVVQVSGVGDFSAVDLDKVLSGVNISLTPYISEYEEGLSGQSSADDLETLLQLNYLYFTQSRLDVSAWESYRGRLKDYLENQELDPRVQYRQRLSEALYDDHLRAHSLDSQDLDDVDPLIAKQIFDRRFSDAGDFTFTFVGSFDMESMIPLIQTWIASLPSDGREEEPGNNALDYFADSRVREEVRAGQETASIVTQIWHGETPWSYDTLYDMAALSAALDIVLIEKVREETGGTYSVSSSFSLARIPEQNYRMMVQFSSDPNRADELMSLVNDIVQSIADGNLEEEYAQKVAQSQRVNYMENLERNQWWLSQIAFLARNGLDWSYATRKLQWYDNLQREDIIRAAQLWMAQAPHYGEFVLFPRGE